uniref:DB domain-containing protein n=1 Tax=Heterorhabditis bacteriophora TaxID=37862 RepID=A0A1I7XP89_HETBA
MSKLTRSTIEVLYTTPRCSGSILLMVLFWLKYLWNPCGMFSADLAEKCSKQRVFTFDSEKEGCSEQDFVRFLHCLAGCKASCTAIHSATSCAAMIQLSDRYLCPSLSEAICGPHGPARRLLTGNCLPVLLPAALSTNTHPSLLNICLLTLMRYTTSSDVVSTLRSISHSPTMIDSFLKQLRAFFLLIAYYFEVSLFDSISAQVGFQKKIKL